MSCVTIHLCISEEQYVNMWQYVWLTWGTIYVTTGMKIITDFERPPPHPLADHLCRRVKDRGPPKLPVLSLTAVIVWFFRVLACAVEKLHWLQLFFAFFHCVLILRSDCGLPLTCPWFPPTLTADTSYCYIKMVPNDDKVVTICCSQTWKKRKK